MNIAIAGTGYVGLVTGAALASTGNRVCCVDMDEKKIALLKSGKSPIYEPGLEELMHTHRDNLAYTTDYATAYRDADVIIIGVGTPERMDGSANLTYIFSVAGQIAASVERDCVVAVKSTVPVGTNDTIEEMIRDRLRKPVKVTVVSNPEFLAQGTAVYDTLHAARIVIGAESDHGREVMTRVYRGFDAPILHTGRRSAEMIKYAANDFLALKISYINEIANLCEMVGASVPEVAEGMGMDPRIGKHFLRAGIGYGGSCFPKDTKALHWLAAIHDYEIKTVRAAIEVNEHQKIRLIYKARKIFPSLEGLNVAVLGLTFKPDTDDLREAPSLVCVPMMLEDGANIRVWDPVGMPAFSARIPQVTCCPTVRDALMGADICFIFTEWDAIRRLTPADFLESMETPIVLDGRNCFPTDSMKGYGLTYISIGREDVNA